MIFGHKKSPVVFRRGFFYVKNLLVINGVVRQSFSAFCTWGRRAATSRATVRAGVMPNAFCILGRFGLRGWRGSGRGIARSRFCRRRVSRVVGCVMGKCGTAFCARGSSSTAARTAFWAGVMPHAFRVLGRFGRFRGRCCWCCSRRAGCGDGRHDRGLHARIGHGDRGISGNLGGRGFGGGGLGGLTVVFAGCKNG